MAFHFNYKKYASLLLFLLIGTLVFATHNRAGEISIEQTDVLTIRATITTYTKTSSSQADRDSLTFIWGDGTETTVARANGDGNGEPLENDVKYNIYIAEHTYPGLGTYVIAMEDQNRNGGILNVNFPNSDNIPLYIQTEFTFFNPQFQGRNNTPRLLQPPVDIGFVGQPFIHNPNAFDQEGDSLAYELVIPLQTVGTEVPNYQFPDQISAGADNMINLDPITGDFTWDSPQQPGEYNIAILIKEFREGILISSMVRDMQIRIEPDENKPPVIETIEEICVVAGETIRFEVIATDPDIGQQIKLTALGGPLEFFPTPATFNSVPFFVDQPASGTFEWTPPCEAISDQYYSVVFKAEDNFFKDLDTFGLADLKTVRIKVVGPAPEGLQIEVNETDVLLDWDNPYLCENTANNYFQGFSIWRREGSNQFPIDTCETGLNGKGYTRIAFDLKDLADSRYVYTDNTVEKGRNYCYRILAEFAQQSAGGNPFNFVESLPSREVCIQLDKDVPFLTKVSVLQTDESSGEIQIEWTKPFAEDLDTIANTGPYRYELQRDGGSGFATIADFSSPFFATANDTTFLDTGLNTSAQAYVYRVNFYVNNESTALGTTSLAQSIYLNIASTDRRNILTWEENVPWDNFEYTIYRKNLSTSVFDSIGTTNMQPYEDSELENEQEYCYYIRTMGAYGIEGLPAPLINLSQEKCGSPIDSVPPCPPVLEITNDCQIATDQTVSEAIINFLSWTNPNETCGDEDARGYHVYFTAREGGDFEIIETLNAAELTSLEHQASFTSVAGCYTVTAFDSIGNESLRSNIICVDNCPTYTLPNVFTPNGDGANEQFVPIANRYVERINLQVFNRWGGLVFETTDPNIGWDGTDLGGNPLAEGVYFYSCDVFESRLAGTQQLNEKLSGYVHIVRGKD